MKVETVSGSNHECGIQVGKLFQDQIQKAILEAREYPAPGLDWQGTLAKASLYWQATQAAYPFIIEEIEGVAKGAGVEPLELFTYTVEELWGTPTLQDAKACSDIVLTAPLTDGRVLVGHNNDLSPSFRELVFAVDWVFPDGRKMLTVGPLGFYVSCGVNSQGIALTGNELTPIDNKIGVPRAIIARAILSGRTIEEAVKIATDPRRASSYNNVISSAQKVVDIEGSGTSFETMVPQNGSLAHTNHYVCNSMLRFEGKPGYISSIARLDAAKKLTAKKGPLTEKDLEQMLADHSGGEGNDNTLCRHGEKSVSVFSITIDFGDGVVRLANGNPCSTSFEKAWQLP